MPVTKNLYCIHHSSTNTSCHLYTSVQSHCIAHCLSRNTWYEDCSPWRSRGLTHISKHMLLLWHQLNFTWHPVPGPVIHRKSCYPRCHVTNHAAQYYICRCHITIERDIRKAPLGKEPPILWVPRGKRQGWEKQPFDGIARTFPKFTMMSLGEKRQQQWLEFINKRIDTV